MGQKPYKYNCFPMAAHPSHPQSLKKQNPDFLFFSKTYHALGQSCKIKPQTTKMASKTFINESNMLKTTQIIDCQQIILGLYFLYHRISKSQLHCLLRVLLDIETPIVWGKLLYGCLINRTYSHDSIQRTVSIKHAVCIF